MTRTELKRWADPVAVARTRVKESVSDTTPGGHWWKEYRVRHLSGDEYTALRDAGKISDYYGYKPYAIESRRVDGTADRTPVNPWEWRLWGIGETPGEVIDEMLGDSDFSAAESLVPEHAELTAWTREIRAALSAEYAADKNLDAATTAWSDFVRDENVIYARKIADKTDAEVEKIKARTLKRLEPRKASLKADIADAKAVRDAAHETTKAVRGRKPKCGLKPDPARTDRLGK